MELFVRLVVSSLAKPYTLRSRSSLPIQQARQEQRSVPKPFNLKTLELFS